MREGGGAPVRGPQQPLPTPVYHPHHDEKAMREAERQEARHHAHPHQRATQRHTCSHITQQTNVTNFSGFRLQPGAKHDSCHAPITTPTT